MLSALIVDDEAIALVSAKASFRFPQNGYARLWETTDPQQALDLLRTRQIDLAVVDIRMPGLSGLNIIKACREEGIQTRFVLLTGYSEFQYAQEAIKYGVSDYLLKPTDDDEAQALLQKIAAFLPQNSPSVIIAVSDEAVLVDLQAFEDSHLAVCGQMQGTGEIPAALETAENTLRYGGAGLTHFAAGQAEDDHFGRMMTYIHQNYARGLSLQQLAKQFSLNYSYCSTLFKKRTGTNFSGYITGIRLQHACSLLVSTNASIDQIYEQVGFASYRYFTQVFKTETGCTPSQYRRQHRKDR